VSSRHGFIRDCLLHSGILVDSQHGIHPAPAKRDYSEVGREVNSDVSSLRQRAEAINAGVVSVRAVQHSPRWCRHDVASTGYSDWRFMDPSFCSGRLHELRIHKLLQRSRPRGSGNTRNPFGGGASWLRKLSGQTKLIWSPIRVLPFALAMASGVR